MPPLLHNRVFFGRRRVRRERNDEELSGKAFYSKGRGRRRVWHIGARSKTTLFRSGVHFGVWGCTLNCLDTCRTASYFWEVCSITIGFTMCTIQLNTIVFRLRIYLSCPLKTIPKRSVGYHIESQKTRYVIIHKS